MAIYPQVTIVYIRFRKDIDEMVTTWIVSLKFGYHFRPQLCFDYIFVTHRYSLVNTEQFPLLFKTNFHHTFNYQSGSESPKEKEKKKENRNPTSYLTNQFENRRWEEPAANAKDWGKSSNKLKPINRIYSYWQMLFIIFYCSSWPFHLNWALCICLSFLCCNVCRISLCSGEATCLQQLLSPSVSYFAHSSMPKSLLQIRYKRRHIQPIKSDNVDTRFDWQISILKIPPPIASNLIKSLIINHQ